MKKTIITLTSVLLFSLAGFAQKTTFGIKGGIGYSHLSYSADDSDEKLEGGTAGFHIGGLAHVQLSKCFAIQPNLLFAQKGGAIMNYKISTMHIEVPVNFLYTSNGFYIGAGPNFSYGISGKLKAGDEDADIYDKDEVDFLALKKFEIGANVLMGYTFSNSLFFNASFAQGLNNIYAMDDGEVTARSRTFGFSVGYMFNHK